MKIKSARQFSLLRKVGWLSGLLLILLAGSWFFHKEQTTQKFTRAENKSVTAEMLVDTLNKKTLQEVLANHQDKTILLSVKDEASEQLSDHYRKLMRSMGGEAFAALAFRDGYVGMVQQGKVIEEQRSNDEVISLDYKNYQLISAPVSAGNYNFLVINKDTIRNEARGLYAYILNDKSVIMESYVFDFYASAEPTSLETFVNPVFTFLPQIEIELSEKNFQRLVKKREAALKTGILLTESDDLLRAKLFYEDKAYAVDLRLKGDWTDHLAGEQWSFRIATDPEHPVLGMRKFSLHHPRTRGYVGEWLFHQILKDAGILHLKYDFVQLFRTVKTDEGKHTINLGVYALEEFFSKQVIEKNKRRAGVLLKIDEDPLWRLRHHLVESGLPLDEIRAEDIFEYKNMQILPFAEKSVRKDSTLLKQFLKGRTLLRSYQKGTLNFSEVFDIGLMARYNAICNLLGSNHALVTHNLRFYYNPVTSRLEPVGFDGNGLNKEKEPATFDLTKGDVTYLTAYGAALEKIIADSLTSRILAWPGLEEKNELIKRAYPGHEWNAAEVLNFNREIIKTRIDPLRCLNIFLEEYTTDRIVLSIENYGRLPVVITDVIGENGRVVGLPESKDKIIILSNEQKTISFSISKNFNRLFVNKKKKKAGFSLLDDIKKIKVGYKVLGTKKSKAENILPWMFQDHHAVANDVFRKSGTVEDYEFLEVDEAKKIITCKPGNWPFYNTIIIPAGYTFQISGGTALHFINSTSKLISFSPVRWIGQTNKPIRFYSQFGKSEGILIMNTKDTSIVRYCEFDNLSNPTENNWGVSGAVNFYNAPAHISKSSFSNNRCEDGLNLINTNFTLEDVLFKNTMSDAFDGDFVTGYIRNTTFDRPGNDAIDISGSTVTIENIVIRQAGDKGLSAGEKSILTGKNIEISQSEIGVASKDNSTIQLTNIFLKNNALGFTAFQKKPEFGSATIQADEVRLENNELDYLIENKSNLNLNNKNVPTVSRVKDQMYGIIYGKSSN